MVTGETGMDDMMTMKMSKNSISLGGKGPFDEIDMGMFTIVKVREKLGAGPGWYQHPKGSVADEASDAEIARDGIKI